MSDHSVKIDSDLINIFLVILLTEIKQTDTVDNINHLFGDNHYF